MKKLFVYKFIFLCIFLMTACGNSIEDFQAKNEVENEIKNLIVEFSKARNNFDTQKMASFLTDDCRIDIQGFAPLDSKSEFLSAWTDSSFEAIGTLEFKNLELNINDEFAEAKTDCSLGIATPDMKFRFKTVRQNDGWLIDEWTVKRPH